MSRAVIMRRLVLLLLMLGIAFAVPSAQAQRGLSSTVVPADAPLVTDLSAHLIAITSSFTGTELLLFGAIDEPGDVVVVVRGPSGPALVRQKRSVFGIWLNRPPIRFDGVPSYYAVASTRPLADIGTPNLLARLQIGVVNLRFRFANPGQEPNTGPHREAILRHKKQGGLYREEASVVFLGPKLFRTEISFPSTVPVGTYTTEVYLVRDDRVIAAQSTPLFVDKQGVEQEIYDFSRREPAVYGFMAVLLAMTAGWIAALLFRR